MNHVVDIDYGTPIHEIYDWCLQNLRGPIDLPDTGGCRGPDWLVCHTTSDSEPYYLITRGRFTDEHDAILFKMRWS